MRGLGLFMGAVLLAACRSARPGDVEICVRRAEEAMQIPDWPAVRAALEDAVQLDPRHVDSNLRLAEIRLKAYGEIDASEECYLRMMPLAPPRALHGLGLCALWRGDEGRALDLMRESIARRATADCARDLAVLLLARGHADADVALGVVERVAAGSLRGELLLAAAGRRPRPGSLPAGWSYGPERARLLPAPLAGPEIEAYLVKATASAEARRAYPQVLASDFRQMRNRETPAGVQREVPESTHS